MKNFIRPLHKFNIVRGIKDAFSITSIVEMRPLITRSIDQSDDES